MRGYYRLINFQMASLLWPVLLLCLTAMLLPIFLVSSVIKDYHFYSVHERFEDVYLSSGSALAFLIYVLILLGIWLQPVYASYWGSKSIYTYLSLPIRRELFYASHISVFSLSLLMLVVAQWLGVFLGYAVFFLKMSGIEEGRFLMENGLFLAFIRSDFLRILLPLEWLGMLSSAIIFVTMITGFYFAVICERSKRYWGFLSIVLAVVVSIYHLNQRLDDVYFIPSYTGLILSGVVLIGLCFFFVWQSIGLLKKGAIV